MINKVILVGNLGADPELRYTDAGHAVCNLRLATSRSWKTKDGEKREETEWHRVTVWGPQAEHCKQYLSKGRQAYIEGRLQTREYEAKDGGGKRYATEVVAETVKFLGGGGAKGASAAARGEQAPLPPPTGDDDIPF